MKHALVIFLSTLFLLCMVSPFLADDQEFFSYYVKPEIWIILDSSGSMAWDFGGPTRMEAAKDALYEVVNDPEITVRWGFATFYQYWSHNSWRGGTMTYAYRAFLQREPMADGDSTQRANISRWIDHNWGYYEVNPNGGTPIPGVLRGVRYRYQDDIHGDTTGARWCRKFYVLLLTDGEPTYGIQPSTYNRGKNARWDGNGSNVTQTWKNECYWEADSLRHTYIPYGSYPNHEQEIDIKTYVIGVGYASNTLDSIALMGGTEEYYPAGNPEELREALQEIIFDIISEATSYSGAEVTSIQEEFITQQYDAKMYICSFVPSMGSIWDGHLYAVKLQAGTYPIDSLPDSLIYWDAGDTLDAYPAANRTIYTEKNGSLLSFNAGNIDTADLNVSSSATRDSIIHIVYSGSMDSTNGYLGDIFHSTPLRIRGPNYWYEDDEFYLFRQDMNNTRDPMIYAGANDGMIHCFKDSTGEELWAFIPNPQLPYLQNLLIKHEYYQDAHIMAADIWFPDAPDDSIKQKTEWHTVMMFGGRQGGYSYSALEVTDPYSPAFMYNLNDTMVNLGETWSDPVMFKVHRNSFHRSCDRFFGFIGGGYWSDSLYDIYNPDTSPPYGNGIYAFDVYNMCEHRLNPTLGTDYWQIDPAPTYADSMGYPMPSQCAVIDTNLDSYADILYVGDVGGQLWKTNINGTDSADIVINNWEADIYFRAPKPSSPAEDSLWQPIFFPATNTWDGRRWWIFFGTGDRANVIKDSTVNRFYALIDSAWTTPITEGDLKRVSTLGPLTESEIVGPPHYKGWYIVFTDFNYTDTIGDRYGEKVASYATILLDTLVFTTFQPHELIDPCASSSGIARLYRIHYKMGSYAGTAPSQIIGTGLPQAPRFVFGMSGEGLMIINLPGEVQVWAGASLGIRRRILWWNEIQ
jgi:type IV pilus assembly protein PilY1